MARVWKPHCAERFFVGGLKKGACEEWVASHIRVTAAPSFCERRWKSIGEQKANCQELRSAVQHEEIRPIPRSERTPSLDLDGL